jgi:hypothetical protein
MMLRNLILASALCVSSTHAFAFSRPVRSNDSIDYVDVGACDMTVASQCSNICILAFLIGSLTILFS